MSNNIRDMVNSPPHYSQCAIECIDVIDQVVGNLEGSLAMYIGNAIKYIWRFPFKNGIEDLRKAVWYLNRAIDLLEKTNTNATNNN